MSNTLKDVLEILSDGELVSGTAIAEQLNVSRTTVWKHLSQLTEWGVPVQKIRGRGYRIDNGLELLSRSRILSSMGPEAQLLLTNLQLLDHVDSTNSFVRQQINEGLGRGYVCLAERQSQGRGRLGRQWISPFGRNIYLSTAWEFNDGVAALEGLSLAVGVAVCRAIQSLGVSGITLKWPNDILLGGRKAGGILLEMLGDPVGRCQVVIGIGINFSMPEETSIDQPWADLSGHGTVTRNGLAGTVLSELLPLLSTYGDMGFSHYRQEWEGYDAYKGVKVKLSTPGNVVTGIARGVSDNGAICLEINGERKLFSGGEISLRSLM